MTYHVKGNDPLDPLIKSKSLSGTRDAISGCWINPRVGPRSLSVCFGGLDSSFPKALCSLYLLACSIFEIKIFLL